LKPPTILLPGLRVLVTGASSGIGATLATMLAFRGARVFGAGRQFSGLAAALSGTVLADVTAAGANDEIVAAATANLGGLDVVVANAGAGWSGAFEDMSAADVDYLVDLDFRAQLQLARAAGPSLLASAGHFVLMGSVAGLVGVPEEVAYSACKAGLKGLADGLRSEWSGRAAVTLVSPGPVATPFFSRRNKPYTRSWPRPVPAARVAQATVRAIETRRADVAVPAWVGLVGRFNGAWPELYRVLAGANARLGN